MRFGDRLREMAGLEKLPAMEEHRQLVLGEMALIRQRNAKAVGELATPEVAVIDQSNN